jgi:hypothetical protein
MRISQAKTAFLVYRSHLETDHQLLSGYREDLAAQRLLETAIQRRQTKQLLWHHRRSHRRRTVQDTKKAASRSGC